MAQLSTYPPSSLVVLVWEDPQASPKYAEQPGVHSSDCLEISSETTVRCILFQNPSSRAKGRITLADYNHPSPTFSVETTRHLIAGFRFISEAWHLNVGFCDIYSGDMCVPAICRECHSFCLHITLANLRISRRLRTEVLNKTRRSWSYPKSGWRMLMQEQPQLDSYSTGGNRHSAFSSLKAQGLHSHPLSRMGAACCIPITWGKAKSPWFGEKTKEK